MGYRVISSGRPTSAGSVARAFAGALVILGGVLVATCRNESVSPSAGPVVQIGVGGGEAVLQGIAKFTFPPNFFKATRTVEVAQSYDASAVERLREFSGLFQIGTHADKVIRLLLHGPRPEGAGSFTTVVNVPEDFVVPTGYQPRVFAGVRENGGEETVDNFHPFPSVWDGYSRTVTATLPWWAFTSDRRADGVNEVVVILGTAPQGLALQHGAPESVAQGCPGAIGWPLPSGSASVITSGFGLRSRNGRQEYHSGLDFRAPTNTSVLAVSDGAIELVTTNGEIVGKPCLSCGYGRYIVLRHNDGSASLYAHLNLPDLIFRGARVSRGAIIANSDNTGESEAPHLHFGYIRSWAGTVSGADFIDPKPCFDQALPPAIGVTPGTVAFNALEGTNPPPQSLTITNEGGGTLAWAAMDNASWLSVSPLSGVAPSSISISANIAGLAPGTYGASIAISATGASSRNIGVTLTVVPVQTNLLTVSGSGTGSGTVTSSPSGISCTISGGGTGGTCSASFTSTTTVTLTATPTSGHIFNGWSGACSGTGSCQVLMSQARSVTASFTAPVQTNLLTVSGSGTGNGAVSSNPIGINCSINAGSTSGTCSASFPSTATVTLGAAAATGHTFTGWSGGGCSGTGVCQVTMSQARNVTATFTKPVTPTELITNGGFESGALGWTRGGDAWITTTLPNPRTGVGYAYFGANASGTPVNNALGTMYQDVSIPSSANTATLTLWTKVTTQETTTTTAFDVLNMAVYRTNGTFLETIYVVSNLHASCGCYFQITKDVSQFRGQTIRIYFLATSDASLPTVFRIDDVSLRVQ